MSGATHASPGGIDEAHAELTRRCDEIEEAYEFMLGYAGLGLPSEEGSASGSQIREFLSRADTALGDIGSFLGKFVAQLQLESSAAYSGFISVLERDARDARAAIQLVMAQPRIGSQLVDNLNASIHLRALLTDLFLIDEVLKAHRRRV